MALLALRLRQAALRLAPVAALFALAAAAATAPAACTSSGNVAPPPSSHDGGPSADGGSGASGPVAHFVLGSGTTPPNYLDVPFPSDAYLSNGSVVMTSDEIGNLLSNDQNFITHGLSTINGFSRLALSAFAVDNVGGDAGREATASAQIDPTTLPVAETDCTKSTSSVFVVDLAPGAGPALLPCRAAFHDDQPRATTTPVIAVGPPRGYLLDPGHQYAVVLTSRVKDTSGRAVAASADFAAVAGGTAPGAIGAMYMKAFAAASAALKSSLATDGATIVSLAPFTTMKKSGELFAMRDALESAATPTLSWDSATMAPMGAVKFAAVAAPQTGDGGTGDAGGAGGDDAGTADAGSADGGGGGLPPGFTASLDDWLGVVTAPPLPDGTDDPDQNLPVDAHDKIQAVGTAVFTAMSYLQVLPGGYNNVAHATFAYDDAGVPIPQAPVKIWVTFAIPKGPMPSGGYPAVILQHGLDGSRVFLMALANTFAKEGWIAVAIDSVTFGARAAEPGNTVDQANNFAGPGSTYKGPDGFADIENGSNDMFGNLQSIAAIGDQFRTGGFDTAQLVRVLRSNPDLSPLATGSGTPQIDPDRIAYLGLSLGAMEGTIAAAIEPHVCAWYLDVNAGSLFPEIAAHSPAIGADLAEGAGFNFGVEGNVFNWSNPLIQVLQQIIEPGDPISYAQYLTTSPQPLVGASTPPRNAVQIESIWDDVVTDEGSEAIARAAGWGLATPNVGSNADITDLSNVAGNPLATPFVMVNPDSAGTFHDTPMTGITAIVVQEGPGQHGENLIDSVGENDFAVPYSPPYSKFITPVTFQEDYRGAQNVAITFFGDAFQGRVPRVLGADAGGIAAPVRVIFDGGS
jgi:dienelactone hydrolase